jgi:hypothetical protein
MKFTIAEWNMIQEVIREELDQASAAINEMKVMATPQGKTWPDDSKLRENLEYHQMKHRWNVLNDILTKLNNEEI